MGQLLNVDEECHLEQMEHELNTLPQKKFFKNPDSSHTYSKTPQNSDKRSIGFLKKLYFEDVEIFFF
jgi:hypothetical protein